MKQNKTVLESIQRYKVSQSRLILEALRDMPNETKGSTYSKEDAQQLGDKLGVDWDKISLDQFHMGLNVELEHGKKNPETNITDNDVEETARIALVHLDEVSDYYTKLKKVEH